MNCFEPSATEMACFRFLSTKQNQQTLLSFQYNDLLGINKWKMPSSMCEKELEGTWFFRADTDRPLQGCCAF
jgi:hypothetical protein